MTLCPYTQLGCDAACKAYQNRTCPFEPVTVEPVKRGRKPKQ